MALATILGFPRMGRAREWKTALEKYWRGTLTRNDLDQVSHRVREANLHMQKGAGLDVCPVNDFSYYDHVLDCASLFGVMPKRFGTVVGSVDLDQYFAMARGAQREGMDQPALEMTKWFDTNYHYIVPLFAADQTFQCSGEWPLMEYQEARALNIDARPVFVGPVSFLLLGKREDGGNTLDLLDALLPAYADLLGKMEAAGASWVQFDEPMLVTDLDEKAKEAYRKAYRALRAASACKLFVTTPFGDLGDNVDLATSLPIDALHIDLVRGSAQLDSVLDRLQPETILALGVVDGRNVWRNDLEVSLARLEHAAEKIGPARVWVTSSCSLLHVPYDLAMETDLDAELKSWCAFAVQKMEEIALLAKGLNRGRSAIEAELAETRKILDARNRSPRLEVSAVRERLIEQPLNQAGRASPFLIRSRKQHDALKLPLFPTTTIGSFPQTAEVRQKRAAFKAHQLSAEAYEDFLKREMEKTIRVQEDLGLDVLVHGEFERNDMVEYFGEQLKGFAFTKHGWVQSYGSRCVKPPVIYGDVWREKPMTLDWILAAQALTKKPVKGMLTGPVTILQWSFVREDVPRAMVAHQIALALQDEVLDLERAGIKVIQIDEPAFREGLPLRIAMRETYFEWAIKAFKLVSTGVDDQTQIHTHMCYSDFNAIIDAIRALDADVISIETSRSNMELLDAFVAENYPNEIGPGVYDIHSPRVPQKAEIESLLQKATQRLSPKQIWVNPDCGLKTRDWPETKASLEVMVEGAKAMRKRFGDGA